jgi:predicted site-specific integrase-resolvase
MTVPRDEYLTYQEAAERYHRKPETIRSWVRAGLIRTYKRPKDRKVYVCVREIEEMRNAEPTAKDD